MPGLPSLRSQIYRAARALGNAEAVSRGADAFGRGVARRSVYRATNRRTRRFLSGFGL